jgi:molybdopterin converting factor subunit 1
MRVTVRLFARLRDLAGTGELIREVPPHADGTTGLGRPRPRVASAARLRETMSVAVNAEYARMTAEVHEGDEVAFMPPVSGGCAVGGRL